MGKYTVNTGDVLGKGAYGVVYPARDTSGKKHTCKHMDSTDQDILQHVKKDLQKLQHPNHENIIKIFDITQVGDVVWVFMEFCENGDLEKYFYKERLSLFENRRIMLDIAEGVSYLHSQNVIHRDIKPANILIWGEFRVWPQKLPIAKLTDFDVSKFLEEDYETSAMTTDVGTKTFKAPEFWMRTSEGKLNYHRNVDVYSMGLTFLAMIQDNRRLVPKIETPNNNGELFQTIGALISERLRYNITPLEVIPTPDKDDEAYPTAEYHIRVLIQKMTRVRPVDRICAAEVVRELRLVSRALFLNISLAVENGAAKKSVMSSSRGYGKPVYSNLCR